MADYIVSATLPCPDCAALRAELAEAQQQRDEAVELLRECKPLCPGPLHLRINALLAKVKA